MKKETRKIVKKEAGKFTFIKILLIVINLSIILIFAYSAYIESGNRGLARLFVEMDWQALMILFNILFTFRLLHERMKYSFESKIKSGIIFFFSYLSLIATTIGGFYYISSLNLTGWDGLGAAIVGFGGLAISEIFLLIIFIYSLEEYYLSQRDNVS